MVAILYKDVKKGTTFYICGGTLVSETRTVTGWSEFGLFTKDVGDKR